MSKREILFHMCSKQALSDILGYDPLNPCKVNNVTLGLSQIYPCDDINGEAMNHISNLKEYLLSNMDDLIQKFRKSKNQDESTLYKIIELIYHYPYLFLHNKDFQMYSLSLMHRKGLEENNNWQLYAEGGRGVALAIDFNQCEHFCNDENIINERVKIYGNDAYYVQDKTQSLIGIVSAVASEELPEDAAYKKLVKDIRANRTYNMTGLSYALNDLYQKPLGYGSNYECRLSCIITTFESHQELLKKRGIIPIVRIDDKKFTYNKNKFKKLLSFSIDISCIKKIFINNHQGIKDEIKKILDDCDLKIPIEYYKQGAEINV